jgi:hypothetical protein
MSIPPGSLKQVAESIKAIVGFDDKKLVIGSSSCINIASAPARALTAWQLTFSHAAKMLRHLQSAILFSLALLGLGFAWLCCWVERFVTGKRTGFGITLTREDRSRHAAPPAPFAERKIQPLTLERKPPRTIDSLIQSQLVERQSSSQEPFSR